jgi:1-acyl-sn-glycerol-3-phosphate acyltransferase
MRNLWMLFRLISITVCYSSIALLAYPLGNTDERFHRLARKWAHRILKVAGVELIVEGTNNIPDSGHCVYVSNHASLFDIPVLMAGINDDLRIMYKRELRRIPFFGWILASSPFIPIDRDNPRNAMEGIERALAGIQQGSSVIVFAEGTRSPDGTLGPFKRGAFLLAARAQKPIIPVAIIGSSAILPSRTSKISSGTVRLVISPAIQTDSADRNREKELMTTVHSIIASKLDAGR